LNGHELLLLFIFSSNVRCNLPRQSPIANRVLHKRRRKLIDRHAMIFLTTYFRTTPIADVNHLRKTSVLHLGLTIELFNMKFFTCESTFGSYLCDIHRELLDA